MECNNEKTVSLYFFGLGRPGWSNSQVRVESGAIRRELARQLPASRRGAVPNQTARIGP